MAMATAPLRRASEDLIVSTCRSRSLNASGEQHCGRRASLMDNLRYLRTLLSEKFRVVLLEKMQLISQIGGKPCWGHLGGVKMAGLRKFLRYDWKLCRK